MAVYCTNCVHYSGKPGNLQKGETGHDDYEGDECAHPSNIESITNYYSSTDRHASHPASINQDNDCPNHYAHVDYEPPA